MSKKRSCRSAGPVDNVSLGTVVRANEEVSRAGGVSERPPRVNARARLVRMRVCLPAKKSRSVAGVTNSLTLV